MSTFSYREFESDNDPIKQSTLVIETKDLVESTGTRIIKYETITPETRFVAIDGKIATMNEIAAKSIDLEHDFSFKEHIYGRRAVEEFGDVVYSQGILIYESKQK